ncbi:aminopeptidase P N-terminal domain-containing protein [Pelomicrobium methylotrophicum]|uniref:Xaa-Pro aminopeptidase n=1 Tax=Pelomicrobium methylotrophicum TaxID=2602750 RepID=A0A5C7EGB2_9PROT|nr:aminopeptidase P N-terminal domain-containing protein [Pelomicrobium methylotrophicum]TXF10999.1 M24 family metallopeptidase [Pelomicrobium methylotrophicum]
MTDISLYQDRRARLARRMGSGVAVVPTAPERLRNRDTAYPYRYDSYFYYLTGFTEPEAVLVLVAGDMPRSLLFCREKDPEKEVWDGFRYGPEGAREAFGFDEARPIAELDAAMSELLADQPAVFYPVGHDPAWDARVVSWVNAVRARVRNGVTAPSELKDVRTVLDEMRLVKDPHELELMRRAARISAAAHRRAMRFARPGVTEYQVEAEILHEFRRHGAQAPAYPPIVASGANACVLHYVANSATLKDGELLLIDAGCELDGYAADITRTFPVNGHFSGAQRDVYQLVLAAQAAAIAAVKPGNPWDAPHRAALEVLAQGLIDLKLLTGTRDEVLEKETYRRFYMHRTGHWLGLDVHDAGDYKRGGEWRPLEPGMTLTVEPGCYVRPADDVPQHFWNIGVRIEDDALVTPEGCEILTRDAPKSIAEIEALMAQRAAA